MLCKTKQPTTYVAAHPGKIALVLTVVAGLLSADTPLRAQSQPAPTSQQVAATAKQQRLNATTGRVVLKVVHPVETRQKVGAMVKQVGGYPVLVTAHHMQVKVPPHQFDALMSDICDLGLPIKKTLQRQDLTQRITHLEASLKAKSEIQQQLNSFFHGANVVATLDIERRLLSLVQEIEQVKGQLRLAREQVNWSVINIDFRFRQRNNIVYVQSPFSWLNSVDLNRFVEEF